MLPTVKRNGVPGTTPAPGTLQTFTDPGGVALLVNSTSVTTRWSASMSTVTVPALRLGIPTTAVDGSTSMFDTCVQGAACSVTVSWPNGTFCLALHSPACTSTGVLPRVKVNGVPLCTPRPARLQILTQPFVGGGTFFLLMNVTIVWVDRPPATISTVTRRLARSLNSSRSSGVTSMSTSWAPLLATSVTVQRPGFSWIGRLHAPTRTDTVWGWLPGWPTVKLTNPFSLSRSGLALQTSR